MGCYTPKFLTMYTTLLTNNENGIFTITINRPEKLNALNGQVIAELEAVMHEVYTNPAIKSVLITGAGEKAFSSGANIKEFKALKDVEITRWIEFGNGINNNIETISKPTIAYINGYAMGGGLELALACDFRLASKNAILSTPEVSNGWLPGWGGMTRIRRLIGEANAKRIILLSEKMDANLALQIGLITKISTKEELHIFTNNLLEIKPQVYAMAKSALMDATRTTYGSDINFDVLAVKISS